MADNGIIQGITYSTNHLPLQQRRSWLREVIGREYTKVDITTPVAADIFTEMSIYPWDALRLSVIRSDEITLQRLPSEPDLLSQDVYFAVIHQTGDYVLQQNGREVSLQTGDISLYDATQAHRLQCSRDFAKLMVSIPRAMLRDRIAGVENCTALRIPGNTGIGAVTSNFIRCCAQQVGDLNPAAFSQLAEQALDLLTLSLVSVRPAKFNLSRSRSLTLYRIKALIEANLSDSDLTTQAISKRIGLTPRYINLLLKEEGTSLMRYIWQRRLENCRTELLNPLQTGYRISEIAFRWGFNDLSHFSRSFRAQFDCSPTECRDMHANN